MSPKHEELKLEFPGEKNGKNLMPSELYLAQGENVPISRPLLIGDVLTGVPLLGQYGEEKPRDVMITQHPCSMREDGVHLHWHIQAIEVHPSDYQLNKSHWRGFYHYMPLPKLKTETEDWVADFDNMYLLTPEQATHATRVACLSQLGVNLLMQRLTNYQTRVVIPTYQFQEVCSPFFEEADLAEEWCESRMDIDDSSSGSNSCTIEQYMEEFIEWIRHKVEDGLTRQELLKNPQNRSTVRRQMREELQRLKKS